MKVSIVISIYIKTVKRDHFTWFKIGQSGLPSKSTAYIIG
jgi:hypothetical protein